MSCLVHLLCGFYPFSLAVAGDLSRGLREFCHFVKPNMNVGTKEETPKGQRESKAGDLPPVVWVHGFFGFGPFGKGKGVSPVF